MANEFGRILKNVGQGIFDRTLGRLTGAGINLDGHLMGARNMAKWSGRNDTRDWRVKLEIPRGATALRNAILENNNSDSRRNRLNSAVNVSGVKVTEDRAFNFLHE